jgi:hypothetical protein
MAPRIRGFFCLGKGQLGFRRTQLPQNSGHKMASKQKIRVMILFVAVDLKQLFSLGRNFPWKKPSICPCCHQSHLWGHGFSDTIFDGYPAALPMRRFMCPLCGCVIKCRPKGYFSRFQTAIDTIKSHLRQRIGAGRWSSPDRGALGRHWLAALKRKVLVYLGLQWKERLIAGFDRLCQLKIIPVSMSF